MMKFITQKTQVVGIASTILLAWCANARTIEITAENVVNDVICSVDLSFGEAGPNETNYLYVVYGREEKGEESGAWEQCRLLQTVTPDLTVYNYPMPDGWGSVYKAIRFFLIRPSDLYDHRVVAIQSTGKEWINTGVTHMRDTKVTCSLDILSSPVGSYNVPFGSRHAMEGGFYDNSLAFFSRYGNKGQAAFAYGKVNKEVFGPQNSIPYDVPMTVEVNGPNLTLMTNGVTFCSLDSLSTQVDGFAPMLLFSLNETKTSGGVDVNAACNTKMILRSFRMTAGETVQCDLVPVIKDGVGLLYDRERGILIGNESGEGRLTASGAAFGSDEVVDSTPTCVVQQRTIAITGTNVVGGIVRSLQLSFGPSAGSMTNVLFAVYGPTAGGSGVEGWARCDRVALIDAETETYAYEMPAGWGSENKAIRFFFAALPSGYDTAVEYLESTGQEWVNTRCRHSASTVIECVADILSSTVGSYNTPFGSRRASTYAGALYFFSRYDGVEKPGFVRGLGGREKFGNAGDIPLDVPLTIRVDDLTVRWATNRMVVGSLTWDGQSAGQLEGYAPMLVFTLNETSDEGGVTANTACNTKMRLRSFMMRDGANKLCDLMPVARGEVGFLFDKVTGDLLENNSGSGAFVTGRPVYGGEHIRSESAVFAAQEENWFRYGATVTFRGSPGVETITDLPVQIRLSPELVAGFTYSQCAMGGGDIRVFDENGVLLPHEIDTWNTEGVSILWTRLPVLPPEGTQVRIKWGWIGTGAPAAMPSNAVWSDYLAVWHFGETGGAVFDSGRFGHHAQPMGAATASVGTNVIAGTFGRSRYLSGGSFDAGPWSAVLLGDAFSFSGWFCMTEHVNGDSSLLLTNKTKYDDHLGWYFAQQNDPSHFTLNNGGTHGVLMEGANIKNNWVFLAGAFDGTRMKVWCQESPQKIRLIMDEEAASPSDNTDTLKLFLDTYGSYVGFVDELRIRMGRTSSDRILADLETVADPSFCTIGPKKRLKTPRGLVFIVR